MLLELFVAMSVILAVLVSLANMTADMKRATVKMAARREAVRQADRILYAPDFEQGNNAVSVKVLGNSDITAGYAWKEVTVTIDGETRSLFGLSREKPIWELEDPRRPGGGHDSLASR